MKILQLLPFRKKSDPDGFETPAKKSKEFQSDDQDDLSLEVKNTKTLNVIKMVVFLTLFISFTNYRSLQDIKNNGRTFVQWGSNSTEYWVSGVDVGTDYARTMAVFLATMWANVTSASAKSQFAEILKYAHPLYLSSLKTRLKERQDFIEKYRTLSIYARLTPNDTLNKKRLENHPYSLISSPVYRVSYKLQQRRLLADAPTPERAVKMVFDFTVENGTARLLDIFETEASNK